MKRFLFILIVGCFLFIFHACKHKNELIPAYIHIEKIALKITNASQGSGSEKISDAWVYIDEKFVGCYELPVTFPVLSEGVHQIKVKAGIKVNGIAASRAPYAFYSEYSQQIDLKPKEILNLTPVVTYATFARFTFMENFENVGIILAPGPAGTSDTMKQTFDKSLVFEGNASGITRLNSKKLNFQTVSNTSYILPQAGSPVYLEFDYKCNHDFTVGIYAHTKTNTSLIPMMGVNPTDKWNKMYAYLTPGVSNSGNATDFNIYFAMDGGGEDGVELLIDNIKLVY
ncbi:MAG TPA: hypothetical protein VFF27_10145 [Bacteroidia bacterium]|jgi:hypothetical protein|nr:hypothetical protein [Bacteroidia bacterium]